jgi:uncharacterized membrane protein (DUF373 family)
MSRWLKNFERAIVLTLLGLMMIAVLVATVELAVIMVQEMLTPPILLLDLEELGKVFSFFLMVLIGLELLETIKAYLEKDTVHAEVVFLVAMVAIARKVIILEYDNLNPMVMVGISTIIIALAVGYYFVKRTLFEFATAKKLPEE